jgi:hypothetical protein
MKKRMYVAQYSIGDFTDYFQIKVFASENKQTVTDWVKKFNRILAAKKDFVMSKCKCKGKGLNHLIDCPVYHSSKAAPILRTNKAEWGVIEVR